MKKIALLYIIPLAVGLLCSCDKDSEGVSKVTTYPKFELKGGSFVNLLVEDKDFQDPGVIAKVGDKTYKVETSGSADLRKPGLYELTYSTKSDEGYSTSTTRKILVTNELVKDNYSGSYDIANITTGAVKATSTVKLKTSYLGWYSVTNMWWQSSAIPGEIVDFGGGKLVVTGTSSFGGYKGTGERQPDGRILFSCVFTTGGNTGVKWSVYFVKK